MLKRVRIKGFKSIREIPGDGLELRPVNVFIGENGAGKSNFIAFFQMLNYMMTDSLGGFVGKAGGANSLLFEGSKKTRAIQGQLVFEGASGENSYEVDLAYASGDSLIFTDECIEYAKKGSTKPFRVSLGAGHAESKLKTMAAEQKDRAKGQSARVVRTLLSKCRVYQFHDTSDSARIKQRGDVANDLHLMSDAGNTAAYLLMLKHGHRAHYDRIVRTVRIVAPFIEDFVVEPLEANAKTTILRWRQAGTDMTFGAYHLSDGTLRFIALCTLLLQPADKVPDLLMIDEPELGLHPHAIEVLAEMLKVASKSAQVVVATQSPTLVNEFEPEDVIVVERLGNASEFRRLVPERLTTWLEQYTLGELWQKNALAKGGA